MKAIVEQLVSTANKIISSGLVTGAGGNLSIRDEQSFWISPSGFSFEDAKAKDYVQIDTQNGNKLYGDFKPSSELSMHQAIFQERPDVNAIIHTHPKMTISVTSSGHDLKPMYADYYVYLGKNVPHLPYITVTTEDLADAVRKEFQSPNCHGVVLRNHGIITTGKSLKEALFRNMAMEEQATIQYQALLVGEPDYLSDEELQKLDELNSESYRRQLLTSQKNVTN